MKLITILPEIKQSYYYVHTFQTKHPVNEFVKADNPATIKF